MKPLHLPVEVEPVSEARWARVEREMFARLDAGDGQVEAPAGRGPATAHRLRWAGVAAAAAAAVALVVAHPWKGLGTGERMRLATTDSASQFTVGDALLVVAPHSLVMVDGDGDHGIDVVLDRGAVTCEVAPRRGRPPFVVDSGDVRVRVVGTRFAVARDADGTSVEVDHGVVEVSSHGTVATLHDGERWPERGTATSVGPSVERAHAAEEAPSAPAQPAPAGPTPGHVPSGAHARVSAAVPAPAPGADPGPRAAEQGSPAASAGPSGQGATTAAAPVAVGPSPQEIFESASRIERARPDEAADAYRQLAAGGTAWAPNALFALARLDAEHGRKAEAVRLLGEYLTRYPRGVNADDARALLARTQ